MPELKLYWDIQSQPSRALKALLDAGDVPHESIHIEIMKGEHKAEAYKTMNPGGSLPFITIDGESLFESAAILRYLAIEYPSLNQFYPAGNILRAKIDAALDWSGTGYRKACILGFAPVVFSRFMGKEPTEAVLAAAQEQRNKLPGYHTYLETNFKNSGYKFICGDQISIADFQIFC